jgi:hypothetical protein
MDTPPEAIALPVARVMVHAVPDAPGGIMLVNLTAQAGLDGADGPWPRISASNGVADDVPISAVFKAALRGRGAQSCEDVTLGS